MNFGFVLRSLQLRNLTTTSSLRLIGINSGVLVGGGGGGGGRFSSMQHFATSTPPSVRNLPSFESPSTSSNVSMVRRRLSTSSTPNDKQNYNKSNSGSSSTDSSQHKQQTHEQQNRDQKAAESSEKSKKPWSLSKLTPFRHRWYWRLIDYLALLVVGCLVIDNLDEKYIPSALNGVLRSNRAAMTLFTVACDYKLTYWRYPELSTGRTVNDRALEAAEQMVCFSLFCVPISLLSSSGVRVDEKR
jgi:hypothetical protein